MSPNNEIELEILGENIAFGRRRGLLPFWMKAFCWLFIITGVLTFPYFIAAVFGVRFYLALYGLETNEPNSPMGILLFALFEYKLVVALLLWFEAGIAVTLGIIDAIIGILVCLAVMFNFPVEVEPGFNFRLEIIFLIVYLVKLFMIRKKWHSFRQR